MVHKIRKSAIAGSWYPDKPEMLRSDIARYLQAATGVAVEGKVVGLVVPHAGYLYSGQVAAHAYQVIRGMTFDAVIVIGPSHRVAFQGVSVYDEGGYDTPLGIVSVDRGLVDKILQQSNVVSAIPHVNHSEHSIEIQLPFLQIMLGGFSFVPLLMGSQDRRTCEDLATAIAVSVGDKRVLLIGSSDLSHFHRYDQAVSMDSNVLSRILNMDPYGLLEDLDNNESEACGGGPTAVVMMACQKLGAKKAKILKYANSGDVTNDRSSVVGYAAAVFAKNILSEKVDNETIMQEEPGINLTEEDKQMLLKLVRKTIEAKFTGNKVSGPPSLKAILTQKRGAFVTLKKQGKLRGCIGYIEARKPLYKTIEEMAVESAFHDPRFPPLQQEELIDIMIEISVLSPLKEIGDIEEIEVGKHGIYLVKDSRSGLLLPQVAKEYGWNRVTFLKETCRKAGLPSLAWQDKDIKIFIFSADIFSSH